VAGTFSPTRQAVESGGSPDVMAATATTDVIRRRLTRDYVVLLPPEELDDVTAPAFRDRLLAVQGNTDVVVDLRRLQFCGSTGLRVLLEAERHLSARDSTLTLSYPPPVLDCILDACGLADHFMIRRPVRRRSRRLGGADPTRR